MPVFGGDHQGGALGVLGVAQGDRAGQVACHLDAVAAVVAAVAGLAPCGTGQVHLSSAAFLIRSREMPRGKASDLSVSKASATPATTERSSAIWPPAAVSK